MWGHRISLERWGGGAGRDTLGVRISFDTRGASDRAAQEHTRPSWHPGHFPPNGDKETCRVNSHAHESAKQTTDQHSGRQSEQKCGPCSKISPNYNQSNRSLATLRQSAKAFEQMIPRECSQDASSKDFSAREATHIGAWGTGRLPVTETHGVQVGRTHDTSLQRLNTVQCPNKKPWPAKMQSHSRQRGQLHLNNNRHHGPEASHGLHYTP